MALAHVKTRAVQGLESPKVTVEVHLSGGLPGMSIVGLPEAAVRESKDRVRAAIQNSGFEYPQRRITVNLAPADLPKDGSRFDLAIAIGILVANGQVSAEKLPHTELYGELSLSGELRPIKGALPSVMAHANDSTHTDDALCILPHHNGAEASILNCPSVAIAENIGNVASALNGSTTLDRPTSVQKAVETHALDLADVHGQAAAKRALEVAAAGNHNILMVGPPGSGKTMLASRLPSILPPLTQQEAKEVAALASIGLQGFDPTTWGQRPFRSPHHTSSGPALVGGGSRPQPGEISLAHHGVLFLDELPEFDRKVLEVLRQPLESGKMTISRARERIDYPAQFQFVAAMNPTPSGLALDDPACRDTPDQIQRYIGKLSQPLLDRIDLHINVPKLAKEALLNNTSGAESSDSIRERVIAARARQYARCKQPNAHLNIAELETCATPDAQGKQLLSQAIDRLGLSARAYHRILKVARTIADLADQERIQPQHIAEAISYRTLDRH